MNKLIVLFSLLVVLCSAKGNQQSVTFKDLPAAFNWTTQGVVGSVKSEGRCGSSLEYSIVDSVSSIFAVQSKANYVQLSMREVVECSDFQCGGKTNDEVFNYVEEHGLSYNYTTCPKGKTTEGVCITGYECVTAGDEDALAAALIQQGPLVVAVDGSNLQFESYQNGIYNPKDCSTTELDTSLLLVGYTQDAWICQNTWGASWGINGYILIARNGKNTCGIASLGCYATGVAKC